LHGVIVQFGGQTPLNLADAVERAGVPILGTQPSSIDLAEDRDLFSKLIGRLELNQPKNGIAYSLEQARLVAEKLGYPLVIRPSYVLGGRAMQIVHSPSEFEHYVQGTLTSLVPPDILARYPNDKTGQINSVLAENPLLFDGYLSRAIEIDVDCLSDGKDVFVCGIMEHIEEAGIHSGDSACSLPPQHLDEATLAELKRQATELALALKVGGLMNIQFALKDGVIYILEVNPRASRTVPFVAKVIGTPIAKIASRIMAGESLASFNLTERKLNHVGVKEAVFPFNRFPGVDTVLGPEMKSTGEVIGLDLDYALAFAKSQMGAGSKVPRQGTVFLSVRDEDKPLVIESMRKLVAAGFSIVATSGTQRYLSENGVPATKVNKVLEGRPHIVDSMKNGGVQLVINTTGGAKSISDSRDIRRTALMGKIPYYTTIPGAVAAVEGIIAYQQGNLVVRPVQDYFRD
ncbi:MAG: carbamoyl phosphate synthase large subunit, partial [Devosia sp.]